MATENKIQILLATQDLINQRVFNKYRLSTLQAYKRALIEVRSLLAELYAKYGDNPRYQDLLKFNRLTALETQIKFVLDKAGVKFKTENKKAIKETFTNSYYQSGFAFEKSTGMNLGFYTISEKKVEAAILNKADRITWINRATEHGKKMNQQIREKIAQGLIQGKGYSNIASEIKGVIEKTTGQLIRVIQTETHRVQSEGNLEAFNRVKEFGDELGFETKKIWVATLDSKTRPTHQELDGQPANEKGLFETSDGATAEAPGLFGIAEEDINCRCTISYEIDGMTPTMRRDNESGKIIEYKTYREWAEGKNISTT